MTGKIEIEIRNMSEDAHKYEFIVAHYCDGVFWFYGAYAHSWHAYEAAQDIDGVVFHNMRIQGYKEA